MIDYSNTIRLEEKWITGTVLVIDPLLTLLDWRENMPRFARIKSDSGVYHVMLRGINHQNIFYDVEDNTRFLDSLQKVKQLSAINVYGYCLMGNHVHLLLREYDEDISTVMKRLGSGFAKWYNWKYERCGHLFQDRYKSEPVEHDNYLLAVLRYIHNNPVKANLVIKPEDWLWSSYRAYFYDNMYPKGLVDRSFILKMFAPDPTEAIQSFKKFSETHNSDRYLDIEEKKNKKSDLHILESVNKIINKQGAQDLLNLPKAERNAVLRTLKQEEGMTCRQIARVLGISVGMVQRA